MSPRCGVERSVDVADHVPAVVDDHVATAALDDPRVDVPAGVADVDRPIRSLGRSADHVPVLVPDRSLVHLALAP